MFAVTVLAAPPVLTWDFVRFRINTSFTSLHVAKDLDGIDCAALIRIDPILSWQVLSGRGVRLNNSSLTVV